jgi:hypothetical protein
MEGNNTYIVSLKAFFHPDNGTFILKLILDCKIDVSWIGKTKGMIVSPS